MSRDFTSVEPPRDSNPEPDGVAWRVPANPAQSQKSHLTCGDSVRVKSGCCRPDQFTPGLGAIQVQKGPVTCNATDTTTGSVFQRSSDQRWVAQIRRYDAATGKTKIIRRYATSERAAKDLLRQLRAGAEEESRRQVRPGMTVAAWLDYWAENSLPVSGLKQTTIDMYLGTVNHLLKPSLGEVLLDKFTPTEAESGCSACPGRRGSSARGRRTSALRLHPNLRPPPSLRRFRSRASGQLSTCWRKRSTWRCETG